MIALGPFHGWIIWLLAGLALLIAEMLVPGAFLMWIGLASIGTGLAAMTVVLGFGAQVVVFVALAAVTLAIGLRLKRKPARLATERAGLAGRSAVVLQFHGREGRVRVGDSDWAARLAVGAPEPSPGARLLVESVDGTVLIVRPELSAAVDP
jgi:inner membrane protein